MTINTSGTKVIDVVEYKSYLIKPPKKQAKATQQFIRETISKYNQDDLLTTHRI